MAAVRFEYDAWRGGFCLQLGPFTRDRGVLGFGGLLSIYPGEGGRICAVESFWDHGGLPLRGIHQAESYPQGEYSVADGEIRVGSLQLRQSAERLELWFSTGEELPRNHWERQDERGVTLWLSQQKAAAGWPVPGVGGRAECRLVAGLAVEFARSVATYPISALVLAAEDFK
jgi:hypothetical protein